MRYLIILLLNLPIIGFSQCCSPGNPVGGSTNMGIVPENTLRTISYYRYSFSDTRYEGSEEVESMMNLKQADFSFFGSTISYGLAKKINIEAELGYFLHKTQYLETVLGEKSTKTTSGLSNLVISVKTQLYKHTGNEIEFTASLGGKIPFSQEYKMEDDIPLPLDIQPSTMAYGLVAQTFLYKGFIKSGWHLFLINRLEKNGYNIKSYRYGNAYYSSLFAAKSINQNWMGILQFRGEYKQKDNWGEIEMLTTGGAQLYIAPQINYTIAKKWNLSVLGDFPIYRYLHGNQLANKYAYSVMLVRDF